MTTRELRAILPADQFARVTGEAMAKPRRKRGEAKAERVAKQERRRAEIAAVERTLQRVNQSFDFTIYAKTPNGANESIGKHWGTTNTLRDKIKNDVANALMVYGIRRPRFPVVVTMTRASARVLDSDGLAISLKYVRDSIARWMNCDDGETDKIVFVPAQEHGPYSVRVSIVPAASPAEGMAR